MKQSLAEGIKKEELSSIFEQATEELKLGGFFEESKSRSHLRSLPIID